MRPLPSADGMRDIDAAPLDEPDTGAMPPAAVAWLRQHLTQHGSALPVRRCPRTTALRDPGIRAAGVPEGLVTTLPTAVDPR